MSGEIVKADDLEAITAELGGNLAIENATLQQTVIYNNAYETLMQSTDLLLKIGHTLVHNLGEQPHKTNLEPSCGMEGCSSYINVSGGKLVIDISHGSKQCKGIDYQLDIFPKKHKVGIKIKDNISNLRFSAALGGSVLTMGAGLFLIPASYVILGGVLSFAGTGFALGVCAHEGTNKYAFHRHYKPNKLFKNLSELDRSNEQINGFIDDYCSLPGRVYSAVEHWITQNQDVNNRLDKRRAEFKQLEEKLR